MASPPRIATEYERNIFFNCPFDLRYLPIFHALIFAAYDCGLKPRCALDVDDAGETRISKIMEIIRGSRLAMHDISRTELDTGSLLPRFNMPFELGLFIGARQFGNAAQRRKSCLILDRERYRFQRFLSDIGGQDIRAHDDQPEKAIRQFRDWLSSDAIADRLPGGSAIVRRYQTFQAALPRLLASVEVDRSEMTFPDYVNAVSIWLSAQPRSVARSPE